MEDRREEAGQLAKKAIATLSEQNRSFPFYSLSLYDMYIRAYPILIRTEAQEEIVSVFAPMIRSLFVRYEPEIDTSGELSALTKEHRRAWLFYILENLVYFTNEEYLASGRDPKHFYSSLLKGVVGEEGDSQDINLDAMDILNGLKIVYRYSSKTNIDLDEELSYNYQSIIHCPSS